MMNLFFYIERKLKFTINKNEDLFINLRNALLLGLERLLSLSNSASFRVHPLGKVKLYDLSFFSLCPDIFRSRIFSGVYFTSLN